MDILLFFFLSVDEIVVVMVLMSVAVSLFVIDGVDIQV